MNDKQPLPEQWVARIMQAMRAYYGSAFDRMWSGPEGCDQVAYARHMREAWGRELGGFTADEIKGALESLPEQVPNLVTFRRLCLEAHNRLQPNPHLALPNKGAKPSAAVLDKLRSAGSIVNPVPGKGWAVRLLQQHLSGYRLDCCRLQMVREALGPEAVDRAVAQKEARDE